MSDLKEIWGTFQSEQGISKEEIKQNLKAKSRGIISSLSAKVKIKMYYALFFTIAFGILIPFVFPLASQILLSIIWVAYLVGTIALYQEYQVLRKGIDMNLDILSAHLAFCDRIKKVIKYEEMVGLSLYPFSIAGGFFFGMQLASNNQPIMDQTMDWVILFVAVALLTILGNWLAKWMNRKAFGKYMEQLEEHIEALSNES